MDDISRVFPYDKCIMLNVLYDTLDALGLIIENANSERGTLIATSKDEPPRRIYIACSSTSPGGGETAVSIFPELPDDAENSLSKVLLDEISSTVKNCLSSGKVK
jgi:hypothetical protein